VVYVEGGPVPVNGGSEGSYTVEPGDTAYAIATKFNVTVEELAAANNMTVEEIAELSVGQKLIIPQRAPEQQPVTTTTPETGEPAATATPEAGGPESTSTPVAGEEGTYTVKEGDIPVTIAEKFGISVEALLDANDITDPTSLKIGQVLVIPTPTPEP
jgi:LysM repeat protein